MHWSNAASMCASAFSAFKRAEHLLENNSGKYEEPQSFTQKLGRDWNRLGGKGKMGKGKDGGKDAGKEEV